VAASLLELIYETDVRDDLPRVRRASATPRSPSV